MLSGGPPHRKTWSCASHVVTSVWLAGLAASSAHPEASSRCRRSRTSMCGRKNQTRRDPPVERRRLARACRRSSPRREHHVEALRRLVVGLHEAREAAAVAVPRERLVDGVQSRPGGRAAAPASTATNEPVRVAVVGDAVDDVARRAREEAARAERERRRRRVLDVARCSRARGSRRGGSGSCRRCPSTSAAELVAR